MVRTHEANGIADLVAIVVSLGRIFLFVVLPIGSSFDWRVASELHGIPGRACPFYRSRNASGLVGLRSLVRTISIRSGLLQSLPIFCHRILAPAFSILVGLEFLLVGVGRMQAILVPAVSAAASAWLVFRLLRPRTGVTAAACAGALYLSLPSVQRWMCAVMIDHLSAFLCIATSALLLRYLEQPNYRNGIFGAVLCAFAILSKYIAVYLVALPLVAILLFRRGVLLKKPSFVIQPFIVALLVGPWVLWTGRLAFYGLPAGKPALTAVRVASFVLQTFKIFPPVLMAVVMLGLLILLALPKVWREDTAVLALLCAGHLSFLYFSPVGPEQRYLLVPAACLLVLSFAGWAAALTRIRSHRSCPKAVYALGATATAGFMLVYFGSYPRLPHYPIRTIVETVLKNKAWAGQRVVVPSDLEGPFIAEFVALEQHRPAGYLMRPSKMLARMDWGVEQYSPLFRTPEQMAEYFWQSTPKVIIWHQRSEKVQTVHEHILGEMLRNNPLLWRKAASFDPTGNQASAWAIYESTRTTALSSP